MSRRSLNLLKIARREMGDQRAIPEQTDTKHHQPPIMKAHTIGPDVGGRPISVSEETAPNRMESADPKTIDINLYFVSNLHISQLCTTGNP